MADMIDWGAATKIRLTRPLYTGMFGIESTMKHSTYFVSEGVDNYGVYTFRKEHDHPIVKFKPTDRTWGSIRPEDCFEVIYKNR